MPFKTSNLIIALVVLVLLFFVFIKISNAQTASELKSKIDDRNSLIQKLEKEIAQYQDQIDSISKEKDTLSNTIKSLDISKKKLEADTQVTQNKIEAKNFEIKQLSLQITDKGDRIDNSKTVISQSLYHISQMDSSSILEKILDQKSLSDLWNNMDSLNTLQGNMQDRIKELTSLKTSLEDNKKQTEKKKAELIVLQNDLKNQANIIADTIKEKNALLTETKNTETGYRQLLIQRQTQKEAYEKEVAEFESALKIAIDPNTLPVTGSGVLKWPLDKIRITQYFGNTKFATKNPQIYTNGSHGGIDMSASIGTPVKSALLGIVTATGNTDVGGCRSYGKWIVIKHQNGLSTLYGHLSLINVSEGQTVATGEIIGYSGNTGLSTGPHLHFGVYATVGMNITRNSNSAYCSNVLIPYASLNAYLNPLSYL